MSAEKGSQTRLGRRLKPDAVSWEQKRRKGVLLFRNADVPLSASPRLQFRTVRVATV